jgi:hypothetical protein
VNLDFVPDVREPSESVSENTGRKNFRPVKKNGQRIIRYNEGDSSKLVVCNDWRNFVHQTKYSKCNLKEGGLRETQEKMEVLCTVR